MVARNEELPEDGFADRHRHPRDPNLRVRHETYLAIRELSARHGHSQAAYMLRAVNLLLVTQERYPGIDPVTALHQVLERLA
jgi:hypothetical protein